MSSSRQCKEFGTAIPAESPSGLCGRCLFGLGLSPGQSAPEAATPGGAEEGANLPRNRPTPDPSFQLPPQLMPGKSTRAAGIPTPSEKAGDRIGRYHLL